MEKYVGIIFLFEAFGLAILSGFHGRILRSLSQKLQIKKGFRFNAKLAVSWSSGLLGFFFFFQMFRTETF